LWKTNYKSLWKTLQYEEYIPGFEIGIPELKSLMIQMLHYEYSTFIGLQNFDRILYSCSSLHLGKFTAAQKETTEAAILPGIIGTPQRLGYPCNELQWECPWVFNE